MNDYEIKVLEALNFEIYVDKKEYEKYEKKLQNHLPIFK